MEKLLTVHEVAEILSISKSTAKVWAAQRRFPVIKTGRLVRVSPQALQEWLKDNTKQKSTQTQSVRDHNMREARKSQKFDKFIESLKQG